MNASILGGLSCKNCVHRRIEAKAMVCTFNPPTAAPLIVFKDGMPQAHGWVSSFTPVNPSLKCGQHKYAAAYDDATPAKTVDLKHLKPASKGIWEL